MVADAGGEGLIIRNPDGLYNNYCRSNNVVKVKPLIVSSCLGLGNDMFREAITT